MVSLFDRIQQTFSPAAKKPASVAELAKLAEAARIHVAACEAAVKELEGRRAEAVLSGEESRTRFRADLAVASGDLDDAKIAAQEIERRLAERREKDEQAKRLKQFEAAQRARDEAAAEITKRYPAAAQEIVSLIRIAAEADARVEAVNAELPEGLPALAAVEDVARLGGHRSPRAVSDRVVKLWCPEGSTEPAPEDQQASIEVVAHDPSRGTRQTSWTSAAPYDPSRGGRPLTETHIRTLNFVRRRFRRIEHIEGIPGTVPDRLASIVLPPLLGGGVPFWSGSDWFDSPSSVIDRLAKLDAQRDETARQSEPRRVVKFELLKDEPAAAEKSEAE